MKKFHPHYRLVTLCTLSALALSACGTTTSAQKMDNPSAETSSTSSTIKETQTLSSRIALTYDGGIMMVDGRAMKIIKNLPKEGFLRLSSAGDNRHLAVADGTNFQMLDAGIWEKTHDDHSHIYTTEPTLASLTFEADHTGHVISHAGKTALFSDGTGEFEAYNPRHLTDEDQHTAKNLTVQKVKLPAAHHGFAIPLHDNKYLVSVGTDDQRVGAAVVDSEGKTLVENTNCPGVHGEAIAAHERITIGCEDGALIYKDGKFIKVENTEDPYSRSGNMLGSPVSDVVLADYKVDQEAELERPEQFALINTTSETRTKVQLPPGVSYTFRSLGRGPNGEALLLTTDGKLRFFDERSGSNLGSVDLMNPWEESSTWQEPRPALWVDGNTAYITDPSTQKLMAVSLKNLAQGKAEKFAEIQLPETPNEISGVSGKALDATTHTSHSD